MLSEISNKGVYFHLSVTNHGLISWWNIHCMSCVKCWRSVIMLLLGSDRIHRRPQEPQTNQVNYAMSQVFATKHWTIDLQQSWNQATLKNRCSRWSFYNVFYNHGSMKYWKTQTDCGSLLYIYPVVSWWGKSKQLYTVVFRANSKMC